jgi:SET domain-containing protein
MKPISFLSESIFIAKAKSRGRGVFTKDNLPAKTVVEIAPVVVMSREDRKLMDKTLLHDYIFEWGEDRKECCMALGYAPLYNHSYESNCEYEMHFKKEIIIITTVRDIKAGEQLFINYNGYWNNDTPVWFEAK